MWVITGLGQAHGGVKMCIRTRLQMLELSCFLDPGNKLKNLRNTDCESENQIAGVPGEQVDI